MSRLVAVFGCLILLFAVTSAQAARPRVPTRWARAAALLKLDEKRMDAARVHRFRKLGIEANQKRKDDPSVSRGLLLDEVIEELSMLAPTQVPWVDVLDVFANEKIPRVQAHALAEFLRSDWSALVQPEEFKSVFLGFLDGYFGEGR